MTDKHNDKWELFTVTYQMPKFGSGGNEFDAYEWHMMVCTPKGRKDAVAACKQHHKGCKVLYALDQLEEAAHVKPSTTPKTSKKKGTTK